MTGFAKSDTIKLENWINNLFETIMPMKKNILIRAFSLGACCVFCFNPALAQETASPEAGNTEHESIAKSAMNSYAAGDLEGLMRFISGNYGEPDGKGGIIDYKTFRDRLKTEFDERSKYATNVSCEELIAVPIKGVSNFPAFDMVASCSYFDINKLQDVTVSLKKRIFMTPENGEWKFVQFRSMGDEKESEIQTARSEIKTVIEGFLRNLLANNINAAMEYVSREYRLGKPDYAPDSFEKFKASLQDNANEVAGSMSDISYADLKFKDITSQDTAVNLLVSFKIVGQDSAKKIPVEKKFGASVALDKRDGSWKIIAWDWQHVD